LDRAVADEAGKTTVCRSFRQIAKEVSVKKLAVLIFLAMLAGFGIPSQGFSQANFYQGKTINVVYGGGPGGTVDLRFRATASILRKHIPGRPTFVIEYMPGGGSRKAGNYIYRARADGLTMGVMLSSFVPAAVLGSSGVLYDIDKLNYLGSPTSGEPYIFLSRKEARLDTIEKLRSASGVRIGAQSVGHNLYNIGRILAYVLGMKEPKFVTGFAQGNEVNLAMMQGELDARWTIQATLVREEPEWIAKKLMDFHVVNEVPKGRRHPHPVFAQLPDIERFTKSEKERKLLAMQRAFVSAGTPFLFPPGTPPDRVQILREAMRKTFADPEFHAEFKKMVGEEPTPLPPQELEKAIRDLPREREVVELFNKLSGADALPLP
jgi:tripartite-type tricarboxylate transporter receptor subunit TctC